MSREQQFDFYWKEIFDGLAYNPIEFNVYRFDQSMSLPSKFNKLYEMLKVLALNNQEVMDYLKEFVETFDEKSYETLEDVLNVWLNSGKLTDFMRELVNEEVMMARGGAITLGERLDNDKAEFESDINNISVTQINKNLGKFDQSYMSEAFLQQITGETPVNAVPADKSITYDKMAFNAVVGVPSRNLFDKTTVTRDRYVNKATGNLSVLVGYTASDFINVDPVTYYVISKAPSVHDVSFYDENNVFISAIDISNGFFKTPINCRFIRITTKTADLDTQQLEKGKVRTPYTTHYPKFDVGYLIPQGVPSRNLFNKDMGTNGFYVNISTGKNSALPGYNASDFMLVEPNSDYVMSRSSNVHDVSFYDENRVFISAIDKSNGQFTTPTNAHFIRVTTKIEHLDSQQIEKGTSSTPYVNALPQVDLSSLVMPREKNMIVVAKENGDFKTITEAVSSATYATKENPVTILIMPGVYKEHVNLAGRYVSLVGVNADTTIIRMDEGEYFRNPLNISANNHIYNLTLISTADEPNNTSGLSAYCIHCDSGALEGKSVIENVRMINTDGVAVGLGTQSNQTYHFKNCDMSSSQNGFYGHNKQGTGGVNQKVIIDNCHIKSQNERALFIQDANHREGGSQDDLRDTEFHFYNNLFWSEINGKTNIIGGDEPLDEDSRWGYIKVSADSYGNNIAELNK